MRGEFLSDQKDKIKEKEKLNILEESFKKAEITRRIDNASEKLSKKPTTKRVLYKSGILIIIFALIGIGLCIQGMPWIYISYEEDYGPEDEWISAKDSYIENNKIEELFKSYDSLGISLTDVFDVAAKATYAFIALLIIGTLFVIFQFIDKTKEFSIQKFVLVHCLFAIGVIIASVIVILLFTRFLGSYLVIAHNLEVIKTYRLNGAIVVSLIPTLVVILYFLVIKGAFGIIKSNFNQLLDILRKKDYDKNKTERKFRGRPL